ncbi:MAG: type IV toxin-antitoxin system AbiEi family antitoxin [Verrucomicrobiota bacterium]|jgi:predicted transcriptional regulator of viral defense system
MASASNRRRVGAAAAFLESVLAKGIVGFQLAQLIKETGLSELAARNQLLRLRPAVTRIARMHAFYLIVAPDQRVIGTPPPDWWLEDYFSFLRHPYYIGLLSAATIHGSQPQAVQLEQVVTDVPRRDITLGRVRIRFYAKRRAANTPTEQPQSAHSIVRVSTREATALDLVRYSARIGGIARAAETIAPMLPKMDKGRLKEALEAANEPALGQRLGYVLEFLGGKKLAQTIEKWLPSRPPWALLEPGNPNRTNATIPRWHLHANARILF